MGKKNGKPISYTIALCVKKSGIPGAGKGLFTKEPIAQGQLIIEYKGLITTYKKLLEYPVMSPYIYYVNKNYVIDAMDFPQSLGRYANDAAGESKFPGTANNTQFILYNKKVYLQAQADMLPGAEIFVAYGKNYWDTMRSNLAIEKAAKKAKAKKLQTRHKHRFNGS